jgi:hypothetical protein
MNENPPQPTSSESQTGDNIKRRGVLSEVLEKVNDKDSNNYDSVSASGVGGEEEDYIKTEHTYDQHGEVGLKKGSISKTGNTDPGFGLVPGEYLSKQNSSLSLEGSHDFSDPNDSMQDVDSWTRSSRASDRYQGQKDGLSNLRHEMNPEEDEPEDIYMDPKNVYDLKGRRVGGKFNTAPLDNESEGEGLLSKDHEGDGVEPGSVSVKTEQKIDETQETLADTPLPVEEKEPAKPKKTKSPEPVIPPEEPPLPPMPPSTPEPRVFPETPESSVAPEPPRPPEPPVPPMPPSFPERGDLTPPPPFPQGGSTPPPLPEVAPMPERTPMIPPSLPRNPGATPPPLPRPEVSMPERIPMNPPVIPGPENPIPNSNVPENDNSLLGKINRENRLTIEAGNSMDLGSEIGWLRSAFNKLSIKMGWTKDIVNYVKLNTIDKASMVFDTYGNDSLIIRKKREIARLDAVIQRETDNPTGERMARENANKIEESIREAEARGDQNMVRALILAKNDVVENGVNRRGHLQAERNALNEQLARYNERKISIVDNFIASTEIQTERIRTADRYHENIANLRTINTETNRMLSVIAETDSQIISLKKALASTRDRVDKAEINDAIRAYESLAKQSKFKLSQYESIGHRLGSFIELTDKRTKRFDDVRDRYVGERNISQTNINNGGVTRAFVPASPAGPARPAPTPAPVSPATRTGPAAPRPTPPAPASPTPRSTLEPTPTPSAPESTTPEPEPTPDVVENPELKKRRTDKIKVINDAAERFRTAFRSENKSDAADLSTIQMAKNLVPALRGFLKDGDFTQDEIELFKKAGENIVNFIAQTEKDGNIITNDNRQFMKMGGKVFKQIKEIQ